MPKGTTAHEHTTAGGTEQWFSIALRPTHGALFRAWAQRLGWSDADLAAHIFRLGTITLALAHLGPHGPTDDPAHLDALIDDLVGQLGRATPAPGPRTSGSPVPDAPPQPRHS